MDNGHSRLLKYLFETDSSNMSQTTTKKGKMHYEIINPSKIDSEVPGMQQLREVSNTTEDIKILESDTFVPVMTVTKKEVVFTKGDTKLQKITDPIPASDKVQNPFYSVIQSETLPLSIRNENGGDDDVQAELRKTTRIPSYKFKEIADRFKVDSNETENKVNKVNNYQRPRRSSIPRLVRSTSTEPEKVKNKNHLQATPNIENKNESEEDEFEKIFHEVVENELPVFENVLKEVKIEDPDKLESNFEEIVHEYDEGKNQPLSLEGVRQSKIPLLRRKSNGNDIKNDNRKLNKTISVDHSKIRTYPRDNDFQSLPYMPNNEIKTQMPKKNYINKDNVNGNPRKKCGDAFIADTKKRDIENNTSQYIALPTANVIQNDSELKPNGTLNDYNEAAKNVKILNTDYSNDEISPEISSNDIIVTVVDSNGDRAKTKELSEIVDVDDNSTNTEINEKNTNDMPMRKSVSSRIAMFERQDPNILKSRLPEPKKITKSRVTANLIIEDLSINDKPIIIEEVLKSPFRNDSDKNYNKSFDEVFNKTNASNDDSNVKTVRESKVILPEKENQAVIFKTIEVEPVMIKNINQQSNVIESEIISSDTNKSFSAADNLVPEVIEVNDNNLNEAIIKGKDVKLETISSNKNKFSLNDDDFAPKTKSDIIHPANDNKTNNESKVQETTNEIKLPYDNIEKRVKRLHSTQDEGKKSIPELDIAFMQGKVKAMIFRMNSMENLNENKELRIREMPKKKSVTEKIALFENKITPIKMEEASNNNTQNEIPKENVEVNYADKIAELKNAKKQYGGTRKMQYVELNNGIQMPVLAVGTALLDSNIIHHIITAAIDLGYRAIDTAFIYGNEEQVGKAIREKIDDGTVKREDLFVMSKLWSTFHRKDLVEKACRDSLERMGLDYFDLFMIHNPMSLKEGPDPIPKIANVLQYSTHDYLDAWYGMEDLVSNGLVKAIGVSNFNSVQINRMIEKGKIKPVVNQVECHPYLNQQRLDNFCSERGIKLSCYGILGSKGTPAELKSGIPAVIDDPIVSVSAAALNVTPAQLLIRYQIDRDHNVVVKSSTAARLWENLQTLEAELDADKLEALNALNKNKRSFTFEGMGDTHRNYPFKIAF